MLKLVRRWSWTWLPKLLREVLCRAGYKRTEHLSRHHLLLDLRWKRRLSLFLGLIKKMPLDFECPNTETTRSNQLASLGSLVRGSCQGVNLSGREWWNSLWPCHTLLDGFRASVDT